MSALTGNAINTSYQGLIKFDDNGTVQPTTLKTLTDGTGGTLPLSISQIETKFTSGSLVDFTGTTVTGLPGGGAAGLISGGTGIGSMKNDAALVTTAPITLGVNDIVIGDASSITYTSATNDYYTGENIAIGTDNSLVKDVDYSFLSRSGSAVMIGSDNSAKIGGIANPVIIGKGNTGSVNTAVLAIGNNVTVGTDGIGFGENISSTVSNGIKIGKAGMSMSTGFGNVAIGGGGYSKAGSFGRGSVAVGVYSKADGGDSCAYGPNSNALNAGSIAIGSYAQVPAGTTTAIVIGSDSSIQTASQRVVLIGNDTALGSDGCNDTVIIGSNTSRSSDTSNSVQLGLLSNLGASNTVAIGRQASATGGGGCAVGRNSTASGDNSFAGTNSTAAASGSAAFNGVTSSFSDTTAVANLQVVGNGNGIKLTSPNGTTYTLTVTDGGLLTVA